jgi:hypothetical protein
LSATAWAYESCSTEMLTVRPAKLGDVLKRLQ